MVNYETHKTWVKTRHADLKQPILHIKGCSGNFLHEVFKNATTINTSFLNSKFIDKCHANLHPEVICIIKYYKRKQYSETQERITASVATANKQLLDDKYQARDKTYRSPEIIFWQCTHLIVSIFQDVISSYSEPISSKNGLRSMIMTLPRRC